MLVQSQPRHPSTTITVLSLTEKGKEEYDGIGPWMSLYVLFPDVKRLWSPGMDSKKLITPAYVAWRAVTITLFLPGS